MMQKIKFQEKEYLLIAGDTIATEEQYKTGQISFATIARDGKVKRFGQEIGTADDIEFFEMIDDIKPNAGALENLLRGVLSCR